MRRLKVWRIGANVSEEPDNFIFRVNWNPRRASFLNVFCSSSLVATGFRTWILEILTYDSNMKRFTVALVISWNGCCELFRRVNSVNIRKTINEIKKWYFEDALNVVTPSTSDYTTIIISGRCYESKLILYHTKYNWHFRMHYLWL
jgi:hypothetical protein